MLQVNQWFSKIFVSEIIKGYKVVKEDPGFYAGTQKKWKV